MQTAREILKAYFGYSEFHPLQEEIINDVLAGKDIFVLMPTGSGKSLCYQLPAVTNTGITVVISPLIALMKDQVDSLRANGIGASFINSTLGAREIEGAKARLAENRDKILYIAPERLTSPDFIPFLKALDVSLFAVDEAHCISEWGHDFRPEYRKLRLLREHFPSVPIVALTATAIPEVQYDIIKNLALVEPQIYKASFNRENLHYCIRPKEDAYDQIAHYLRQHSHDSGIIYCQSRRTSELLAEKLQGDGFRALPYHAGMLAETRNDNQEKFIRDDAEIIVATIAFGMGINKPNVRFVMHYDLPKNLESYYQETGRAGRDRLKSDCILFFSYGDKVKIERFIEKMKNPGKKRVAYTKLEAMIRFCESAQCRRRMLLGYFGEIYNGQCVACDNCLRPRETFDGTEIAKRILTCVHESGQRFGTNYIISLLTGKGNKRSAAYNHSLLKSFGAEKSRTAKHLHVFIRELANQDCLDIAGDKYPVLKLNQKSRDILSGKETVFLTKPAEQEKQHPAVQTADGFDHRLFEMLRVLRKKIADTEGVPPYIVFPDTTLKELATYYQQDAESLKTIRGVGKIKLERYGDIFLDTVRDYCRLHSLAVIKKAAQSRKPTMTLDHIRESYPRAYEPWTANDDVRLKNAYFQGKTVHELAHDFERKPDAIRSRLKKLGVNM